jgi:hypothetical protein
MDTVELNKEKVAVEIDVEEIYEITSEEEDIDDITLQSVKSKTGSLAESVMTDLLV